MVATDHSPAPPAMKRVEEGDLEKAWGGISSLQVSLPVLWTAAVQRGFGVEDVMQWICAAPAMLAGEAGRRGKIAEGYRADLVIWDPDGSFRLEEPALYHRHKGTPYLGEKLYGVVQQTWLGGEKVFDGGKFTQSYRGRVVR